MEPVAVFEFGVAVEVFGVDRTDDGVPRLDFRACAAEPGRPLATQNTASFTVVPTYGLDAVAGSDLVIVCPTRIRPDDEYPAEVLDVLRSPMNPAVRC